MATANRAPYLPHLRELDGIRGIAALLVFFHHLCSASINTDNWSQPVLILRSICQYGTVGVDIFFVLSGFLITSLLIRDRTSPAYYKDFYWKRALRILPLYLVCLLGALIFIPGSGVFVLMSAAFVSNFSNLFHIAADGGPFWSLAIEEQFYLAWPTVVRRRSVASLSYWALAIALASIGLRIFAAHFGHYNYHLTFLRADGLAAGALIACRFERRQREGTPFSVEDRYLLGLIAIGIALIGIAHLPVLANPIQDIALVQTAVTILSAGGVGLAIAHTGSSALAPLRSRALTFFGLISYAFYMVHLYVMQFYDHIRGPLRPGDEVSYALRVLLVLIASVGISLVSRYVLELPALSLRHRVLSRPTPKAETEEPLFAD